MYVVHHFRSETLRTMRSFRPLNRTYFKVKSRFEMRTLKKKQENESCCVGGSDVRLTHETIR